MLLVLCAYIVQYFEFLFLTLLAQNTVRFSFSVQFKASDVAWASRWDTYLRMSDVQIHWFAICNSVAIVLFLTGMSCTIMFYWYDHVIHYHLPRLFFILSHDCHVVFTHRYFGTYPYSNSPKRHCSL